MARTLAYGPDAVLVEVGSSTAALALAAAVRSAGPAGVIDVVPGACTVLVTGPGARDAVEVVAAGDARPGAAPDPMDDPPAASCVDLPVRWDGPDLAEVARLTGLVTAEVVAALEAADLRVAFCGFAPGFAYLAGLPPALRVPRLETPRPTVPAGSVAVAGQWAGVYPSASPGGWRLLGRTDAVLFDPSRASPALLPPGTRVRLVGR